MNEAESRFAGSQYWSLTMRFTEDGGHAVHAPVGLCTTMVFAG